MNNLSADLFANTRSTGMIMDSFVLTLKGKALAFNKVNATTFRPITEAEFSAIEACYHSISNGVKVSEMDSRLYAGACDASVPFVEAKAGAVLFPEQHQPWEADNEAFIEEYKGVYSLTYIGEVAFDRFLVEAKEVLKRAA